MQYSDILLTIGCAVLLCVFVEYLSVFLLRTGSLTHQRIVQQLPAALRLRHGDDYKTSVLLVGNSGMVHGVDSVLLKTCLGVRYEIATLFIEATSYLDWYYGLRRLFAEGSEPDLVIVALTATSFLENQVRGDYFSNTLLRPADVLGLSRDLECGWLATASLFLGTVSKFWSHRGVIRARILSVVMSDRKVRHLVRPYVPKLKVTPTEVEHSLKTRGVARLKKLESLCAARKARLVILLPPVVGGNDHFEAIGQSACVTEAKVVLPLPSSDLSSKDFPDGSHLAASLVGRFTRLTAVAIDKLIGYADPDGLAAGADHGVGPDQRP